MKLLWTLIRRENDPTRIDWAALCALVLYVSLALAVTAFLFLSFLWIDLASLRGR